MNYSLYFKFIRYFDFFIYIVFIIHLVVHYVYSIYIGSLKYNYTDSLNSRGDDNTYIFSVRMMMQKYTRRCSKTRSFESLKLISSTLLICLFSLSYDGVRSLATPIYIAVRGRNIFFFKKIYIWSTCSISQIHVQSM